MSDPRIEILSLGNASDISKQLSEDLSMLGSTCQFDEQNVIRTLGAFKVTFAAP